jgi:two-component system alkaline phosphatase synthesis response regulator PhoP
MAKKTIVLVDDEPDILEFVSYNLEKEGYNVITFSNGETFLEKAPHLEVDLVVLDIMMPGLDGIEVCARLRMMEQHTQTVVAFLTARGEDETQIQALDSGGDDFIQKPVKPKVFVARVKSLLKRSGKKDSKQVLEFDDLIIDRSAMIVIRGKKRINLVKKEFQLLYLLATKPGKVFSRQEILAQVWGTDVIVGDRTIDVHVRKLREKIGQDYIRTVKGVGYKFEF